MFSKNALDALNASQSCARQLGHDHVGCEHILLSILAIPKCQACARFEKLDLKLDELSESMKTMIASPSDALLQRGALPLTARTRKVLQIAEMLAGKGNAVDTVNLVAAMLREGENAAAQLLFNAGVTLDNFMAAGTQGGLNGGSGQGDGEGDVRGESEGEEEEISQEPKHKPVKTPTVNAFGRDLTELARLNKLDPVVGRTKELKRIIQILSRRSKNNAVLIGEAGVGKTAVVEGLAQAILIASRIKKSRRLAAVLLKQEHHPYSR